MNGYSQYWTDKQRKIYWILFITIPAVIIFSGFLLTTVKNVTTCITLSASRVAANGTHYFIYGLPGPCYQHSTVQGDIVPFSVIAGLAMLIMFAIK